MKEKNYKPNVFLCSLLTCYFPLLTEPNDTILEMYVINKVSDSKVSKPTKMVHNMVHNNKK